MAPLLPMLVAGLLATPAEDDPWGSIQWDAPAECGTADDLRVRMDELSVGTQGPPPQVIGSTTGPERGVYRLQLQVAQADGRVIRRSFTAADCHTLLEAAALIATTSFEIPAQNDWSVPETPATLTEEVPVPREEPGEIPEPAPDDSSHAAPPPPRQVVLAAKFGMVHEGVDTPTPAAAGMLSFGLQGPKWRVQLDVEGFGRRYRNPYDRGTVDVAAFAAVPRVCGALRVGRWGLLPCAGVGVGVMRGQGVDVEGAQATSLLWSFGSLGALGNVELTRRLGLVLDAAATVAITRPRLMSGGETVYRAGPAGGRLLLGLEIFL